MTQARRRNDAAYSHRERQARGHHGAFVNPQRSAGYIARKLERYVVAAREAREDVRQATG